MCENGQGGDFRPGGYSLRMMGAGFARAARKPWTLTVKTAIARMAADEAAKSPQAIPA